MESDTAASPAPAAKRWIVHPTMPRDVRARLSAYHPVLAQVLYNRGQDTPDKARAFLDGGDEALHDPSRMSGMAQAVARIRRAIKRGERIAVYGDFDADGVTSTVLLTETLNALGGRRVRPYIPHRVDEGYGLNNDALDALHREGVALVITVDCGIRSGGGPRQGHRPDIIVTDHHPSATSCPRRRGDQPQDRPATA